ncbi:MAG: Rieske 2Fe-2S domain-containing protein [Myxococcaceae bacterium]|nr:Rieske 2Fe-2S domain-containing protein [Myxococcaceae bacterium]
MTFGRVDDISEGELRSVDVGRRTILLCKVGGKIKALDDWCNHAGCLLSGGRLEGNMVVCACHEIGFDLDTGQNMTSPGICDDQPVFHPRIEGEHIVIDDFEMEG